MGAPFNGKTTSIVSSKDFHFKGHLGEGCYSQVYSVTKLTGDDKDTEYAMKMVNLNTSSAVKCVSREREILGRLSDNKTFPFVTSLYYSFIESNHALMAITLARGGDLFDVLDKCGTLPESEARFYIAELICSIEFLHSKGIVHLDIKPENILLNAEGHVYLCDFDRAFDLSSTPELIDFQGTPLYMAPEIAREENITAKADVWSIGMIAGEIVAGPMRSSSNTDEENKRLAKEGRYYLRPVKPLSKTLTAFLNATFRKKVTERPTASELKQLRFLKPINWDMVTQKGLKPPYVPLLSSTKPKSRSSSTSVFTGFGNIDNTSHSNNDIVIDGFDHVLSDTDQNNVFSKNPPG